MRRRIAAAALASVTTLVAMFAFKAATTPRSARGALSMFGVKTEQLGVPQAAAVRSDHSRGRSARRNLVRSAEARGRAGSGDAGGTDAGGGGRVGLGRRRGHRAKGRPGPEQTPSAAEPASPESATLESAACAGRGVLEEGPHPPGARSIPQSRRAPCERPRACSRLVTGGRQDEGLGARPCGCAVLWASTDPSPDAQLYLARIQRSAGQRYGAVATLTRLLEQYPDSHEAQDLLDRFADKKIASR
jgi:hypothetical protein